MQQVQKVHLFCTQVKGLFAWVAYNIFYKIDLFDDKSTANIAKKEELFARFYKKNFEVLNKECPKINARLQRKDIFQSFYRISVSVTWEGGGTAALRAQ